MKTEPEAIGTTTQNEFGSAKLDLTPIVLLTMWSGAQKMKTGPEALGAAENESGSAKHEKLT
jgi:hypothetical protein